MTKQVIAFIEPFSFQQKIFVYDGSNEIESLSVTLTEFADTVVKLCHNQESDSLILKGDKQFTGKIRKEVESRELFYYDAHTLKITLA